MIANRNIQKFRQISNLENGFDCFKNNAIANCKQEEEEGEDIDESWVNEKTGNNYFDEEPDKVEMLVCCKKCGSVQITQNKGFFCFCLERESCWTQYT